MTKLTEATNEALLVNFKHLIIDEVTKGLDEYEQAEYSKVVNEIIKRMER